MQNTKGKERIFDEVDLKQEKRMLGEADLEYEEYFSSNTGMSCKSINYCSCDYDIWC